jgi:hypothetical protein
LAMFFSTSALAYTKPGRARSNIPKRDQALLWGCPEICIDVSCLK